MVKCPTILSLVTLGNLAPGTSAAEHDSTCGQFNVMALGDWGAPLDTNNVGTQAAVATIMGMWIETYNSYSDVFDLGDSLYWNGVIPTNVKTRMKLSFEDVYPELHQKDIFWSGLFGNHGYGGGGHLCIKNDVNISTLNPTRVACERPDDVIDALNQHVLGQQTYAKYNKLWYPKQPFYMRTFTRNDIVVDVFFVDMNSARVNGVSNICCQCYGQANTNGCEAVTIMDEKRCADGRTDIVKACSGVLNAWENESIKMIEEKACSSKADHKLLLSHYNVLLHLTDEKRDRWIKVLNDCGVTLSASGHTHGMALQAHAGISFITSGNGGGRPSEIVYDPVVGNTVWKPEVANYGFTALSFNKTNVLVQYVVVKEDSIIGSSKADNKITGFEVAYSFSIPAAKSSQLLPVN